MPDIHLKYGGSTMHRTVACTGWQAEAEKIKQLPTSSPAADRGSCLHELVEVCLNDDKPPQEWLGYHSDKWDYTVTQDDVNDMLTALAALEQLMDDYGLEEWATEEFVQLSPIIGGSADIIACGPKYGAVIDWKFGYQPVSAEKSWQGGTYLLSALENPDLEDMLANKTLLFAIIQPAASDKASVYEYPDTELFDMEDKIFDSVEISEAGEGELVPGDHCMFCPAAPICPAKLVQANKAKALPKDIAMSLDEALDLAEHLEPWVRDVKKFAHEMLEQGADVPGWKLVDKRATRKWADNDEIETKLNKMRRLKLPEYADIKIKSPAQLEKVCKGKGIKFDKEFGDMIIKQSSGTTLARDDDPREPIISQGDVQKALASI